MIVTTHIFQDGAWNTPFDASMDSQNTLLLFFASIEEEKAKEEIDKIARLFPSSVMLGASTSGEIYKDEVYDDTIVVSVVKFQSTTLKNHICEEINNETSYNDGVDLAKKLYSENLRGIFVLSDGLKTNGSKLTEGIASVVGNDVVVSGGLAGDKDRFEKTWVLSDCKIKEGVIAAVGFYGDAIHFEAASKGGWDSLGLQRVVTKSENNVLYELDGKPALEIYKRYLGEKSKELPASGLLFPLEIHDASDGKDESKVRTVLAVDEEHQSITFAGDIPQGAHVTFMKANFNRLINGAEESAEMLDFSDYHGEPLLCIAISCVGRKLVLKSRIDEEVEAIKEVLPENSKVIGFYSYGEISPLASGTCSLHNQTMTLTAIWESDA